MDGERATVVKAEPELDLVLLRVDVRNLSKIKFGKVEKRKGVFYVGNPLDYRKVVVEGKFLEEYAGYLSIVVLMVKLLL